MVHLKAVGDIMVPYGVKLIFHDTSLLDRFMLTAKLLRSRCEQKLDFGNSQVKTGSVIKLVLDEVSNFLMTFSSSSFKEMCIEYLEGKDKEIIKREDIRLGIYVDIKTIPMRSKSKLVPQ